MAISTFAELKTAITSWSHGTAPSGLLNDFVALAEARIRTDVRCRAMIQSATGTPSSFSITEPTRFLEVISLVIDDTVLSFLTPNQFDKLVSTPHRFYTQRNGAFEVGRSEDYVLTYYQAFAPFSGSTDANWLLTNFPDIYLSAAMAEVAVYTRDDPTTWNARYQAGIAKLKNQERLTNGPLVVRPDITVV